jgi:hypothetical protein
MVHSPMARLRSLAAEVIRARLALARRRISRCLGLILSGALVVTAAGAAAEFQGIDRSLLRRVLDRSYNLENDVPEQLAQLQREHPDSLAPEFIRVVREYWLQNYAETNFELTAAFERDSLALIEKTRRQAREHPADVDADYLAGMSQLLSGLYNVEKQHWWPAFWKVRAGRNAMLRLLSADPDYADAKMAAGLADCYLDRTPGYLKPLTLLLGASGDMDRGLQRLREARDHGLIASIDAAYYLSAVQNELSHDQAAARDEMALIAQRFPANPFYQRLLGYFEIHSGLRERGRQRLARISEMAATRAYPALAVRSQMWLCWDCMSTKDYAEALQASERAERIVETDPHLNPLRAETLFGQGESLKALGHYKEAFARFDAVSPDNPTQRQRAMDRVRDIKKEIGAKE